jgi:GNAT superfamily N-acetyltransferase
MKQQWKLRLANESDVPALEKLIPLSVRGLSRADYSSAQMDAALGSVFGVDRQLIRDGTYFVVAENGELIGCGGWSKRKTLFGSDHQTYRDDAELDPSHDAARIRAFFIHPDHARRGLGRAILEECEKAIRAAGFQSIELAATLPGVPFYSACGYSSGERSDIPLSDCYNSSSGGATSPGVIVSGGTVSGISGVCVDLAAICGCSTRIAKSIATNNMAAARK